MCKAVLVLEDPRLSSPPRPRFSQLLRISSTDNTQKLLLYSSENKKNRRMSQFTIDNSTFSNNRNSFNVQNYYVVADDRSPLLTWLSPLEPKLRHRDIQERRVDHIGEWLLQTEEFRSWRDRSGEGEGGKPVLFGYGGPGVGKTLIR